MSFILCKKTVSTISNSLLVILLEERSDFPKLIKNLFDSSIKIHLKHYQFTKFITFLLLFMIFLFFSDSELSRYELSGELMNFRTASYDRSANKLYLGGVNKMYEFNPKNVSWAPNVVSTN